MWQLEHTLATAQVEHVVAIVKRPNGSHQLTLHAPPEQVDDVDEVIVLQQILLTSCRSAQPAARPVQWTAQSTCPGTGRCSWPLIPRHPDGDQRKYKRDNRQHERNTTQDASSTTQAQPTQHRTLRSTRSSTTSSCLDGQDAYIVQMLAYLL